MIKDKFVFILDEKAGHKASRPGVLQTVHWFESIFSQLCILFKD